MKRVIFALLLMVGILSQPWASAANIWQPSATEWATIAFEDNWPVVGDYDMNDLVMRLRFRETVSGSDVTGIDIWAKLQARGASYRGGFAIQIIGLKPDNVATCAMYVGSSPVSGYTYESGHSIDNDFSTTYVFFDDATLLRNGIKNPNNAYGNYEYLNTQSGSATEPGSTIVTDTDEIHLALTFKTKLGPGAIANFPFNPFMFRTNERGREVHLPSYPATDLANKAQFTQGNANGTATAPYGQPYLTKASEGVAGNLPWALYFLERWNHPIEAAMISMVYPDMIGWINSQPGTDDWYLRPNMLQPTVYYPYPYDATVPH